MPLVDPLSRCFSEVIDPIHDFPRGTIRTRMVLDGWFPLFNDQKFSGARWLHPHLGNEFKVIIMKGEDSWEAALASAGRVLQEFRSQKGNERDVKQAVRCGRLPVQAPQRVVFGLPLTFRYPPDEVQFVPTRAGARHASLLRLRVVELGKSVHPLLVRLAGPVPGVEPASDAKMEIRRGQHRKTIREELPPVESKLLDEFMDWLGRGA